MAIGVPDLAVANLGSNTVSILIRGATAFTTEATIPVGNAPSGLATADFNGDGKTDVAVAPHPGTRSKCSRGTPRTTGSTPARRFPSAPHR